ncbi:hypothetical protein B9S53_22760 [Arthrospira sp. O9.13F]|nr:hypothetical protein B9S53_22760 [Arthrospira sp. O9.13F]
MYTLHQINLKYRPPLAKLLGNKGIYQPWDFRNLFRSYVLCLVLLVLIVFGFPEPSHADIVTVDVAVEQSKYNNESWDVLNGAPDLAICLSNQRLGTVCIPDGSTPDSIKNPNCSNSYLCRFSLSAPPNAEFKVSVVDVDVMFNDIIGAGWCRQGMTCEIGQAKVAIK